MTADNQVLKGVATQIVGWGQVEFVSGVITTKGLEYCDIRVTAPTDEGTKKRFLEELKKIESGFRES